MKKYLILIVIVLAALLRVIGLDKFPAGLNADEAAIGYNAWSLINTGMDEHGTRWPTVFRSFDDYKPAVYFYLVLPFVKVLGLNIWAVRLPSAILGTLSVYLLYLIVNKLDLRSQFSVFSKNNNNLISDIYNLKSTNVGLITAFVLAISPWHLQFSRGGWEVNVSTFFILLGIFGFLKGLENSKYFFLFVISMVLSLYTYHSSRLVAPFLSLTLVILYWSRLFVIPAQDRNLPAGRQVHKLSTFLSENKIILLSVVLGIFLVLPLASQMLSKEGQSRFTGVSVFSDEGPLWEALILRRQHSEETKLVRYTHSRYVTYALRFTKNYLSHFSPRFLFLTGDEIARSKVPETGQSLLVFILFFFIGLLNLLKLNFKWKKFILSWLLFSPVAASLTFQSPHALRSQNMVIPLSIISALGLCIFIENIKSIKPKLVLIPGTILLALLVSYSFGRYLHMYYDHYPKELPYAWQYGFDQVAEFTKENYAKYDKIIISDRYDQPYILMAFFLQYPPEQLQKELVMTPRDKFGFSTVRKMGKYEFRQINWEQDRTLTNTLIVSTDEAISDGVTIKTIYDPAGKPMYLFHNSEN